MRDAGTKKYVVLESFLSVPEQQQVVSEVLECHSQLSSSSIEWESITSSTSSLPLQLGISCGGDLSAKLPMSLTLARRAFLVSRDALHRQGAILHDDERTPLTGLALMYGPHARMKAHYDSPTQPSKREEWLCIMTVGATVQFRANHEILSLHSGDVLIMDSMAVLHGVEGIVNDDSSLQSLGLPHSNTRLGVLFWQAAVATAAASKADDASCTRQSEEMALEAETMATMFGE